MVDTVGREVPIVAKGASQVDGSILEEINSLDREQYEMSLFRRIHFSLVPIFEFDKLFNVCDLESIIYVSEDSLKNPLEKQDQRVSSSSSYSYLSHRADGE